jgi:hypothetical protein
MRTCVRAVTRSAYSGFSALTTGNLQLLEAAAAGLPKVSLEDALASGPRAVGAAAHGDAGGAQRRALCAGSLSAYELTLSRTCATRSRARHAA